jgi:hypothetical protein
LFISPQADAGVLRSNLRGAKPGMYIGPDFKAVFRKLSAPD